MQSLTPKRRKELFIADCIENIEIFHMLPDTDMCADHIETLSNKILEAIDRYEYEEQTHGEDTKNQ
jgi:hypothetical protein